MRPVEKYSFHPTAQEKWNVECQKKTPLCTPLGDALADGTGDGEALGDGDALGLADSDALGLVDSAM